MDQVSALVRQTLPPACARPESIADVPTILFSDFECLKSTISLVLGMGVVFLAGVVKLPQIAAIVSAQSAEGISVTTFFIESFSYMYNLAVHMRMGYPVSTYGDFAVLLIQNAILISLVYRFQDRSSTGLAVVVSFLAFLGVLCSPAFPLAILKLMPLCNVPVSVGARVPQIVKSFRAKSTGTLSALTCLGLFFGASARVFTTFQDVDSVNILIGYLVSATLNGIVAFQVLYYGNQTQATASDKSASSKKTD